jgi:hypothetical protein
MAKPGATFTLTLTSTQRATQVWQALADKECKGGNKMIAVILATLWIGGWAFIIEENIRIGARIEVKR